MPLCIVVQDFRRSENNNEVKYVRLGGNNIVKYIAKIGRFFVVNNNDEDLDGYLFV
jgi:hypothetical protein